MRGQVEPFQNAVRCAHPGGAGPLPFLICFLLHFPVQIKLSYRESAREANQKRAEEDGSSYPAACRCSLSKYHVRGTVLDSWATSADVDRCLCWEGESHFQREVWVKEPQPVGGGKWGRVTEPGKGVWGTLAEGRVTILIGWPVRPPYNRDMPLKLETALKSGRWKARDFSYFSKYEKNRSG